MPHGPSAGCVSLAERCSRETEIEIEIEIEIEVEIGVGIENVGGPWVCPEYRLSSCPRQRWWTDSVPLGCW